MNIKYYESLKPERWTILLCHSVIFLYILEVFRMSSHTVSKLAVFAWALGSAN
jgi:hypothetical protein